MSVAAKYAADEAKFAHAILSGRATKLVVPLSLGLPDQRLMARLAAKVSIEFMAERFLSIPNWEEALVDDPQLDPLRRFARIGAAPARWPISVRRIYDEDAPHEQGGASWQVLHEFDFLYTDERELYGVMCIFGLEVAINVGGPEIDDYDRWLNVHNDASPLYQVKQPKR